jgi:hypothetical protein
MSCDHLRHLEPKVLDTNMPLVHTRAGQYRSTRMVREAAQPFGVRKRVDLMKQLQICEVVNIYLPLKNNHNIVLPQFYGPDIRAEGKLPDATALVIVPDHHLVWRVRHVGAAAYKSEDVATEQHLDDAEPAAFQIPPEGFLERVAIEDPEPVAGASGEATAVLVPSYRQELDVLILIAACFRLVRRGGQRPGVRRLVRPNLAWGM